MTSWMLLCALLAGPAAIAAPVPRTVLVMHSPLPADADLTGVQAVVLPLLQAGRSSLPGDTSDFATHSIPVPWAETIEACHGAAIMVLGGVDLLRWSDAEDSSAMLARHQDWFEVDSDGHFTDGSHPEGYASLWLPEASEQLKSFLDRVAEELPDLDGLVVSCSYPWASRVGFSPKARAHTIRSIGSDPADMLRRAYRTWIEWCGKRIGEFLKPLAAAYKQAQPDDVLWVQASPDGYRRLRYRSPEGTEGDWVAWLSEGIVDGCVLVGPWSEADEFRGSFRVGDRELPSALSRRYAAGLALVAQARPAPFVAPALCAGEEGRVADLGGDLKLLGGQGAIPALAVVVEQPGQLAAALAALRSFVPSAPAMGERDTVVFDASAADTAAVKVIEAKDFGAGGLMDTVAGQQCVRTDGKNGLHWILFDVPDDFAYDEGTRLTLALTYLDAPAGLMSIRVDSTDRPPGAHAGPMGQIDRFVRPGTGEWCTRTYDLTRSLLSNATFDVGDIAITGYTSTGDPLSADVAVSRVVLTRRHVELTAGPDVVAAADGGKVTLTARCSVGTLVPAPDGTPVHFTDESGLVDETVATAGGNAVFAIDAPTQSGRYEYRASWDDLPGRAVVQVLDGRGPIAETEVKLADFDAAMDYRVDKEGPTTIERSHDAVGDPAGGGALKVHYTFDNENPAPGNFTAIVDRPIPGIPSVLTCRLYGDGHGQVIHFIVRDRDMEYFHYDVGQVLFRGWRDIPCDLTQEPSESSGPAGGNGRPDPPLHFIGVRINRVQPAGPVPDGTIGFDEVWVATKTAAPQ